MSAAELMKEKQRAYELGYQHYDASALKSRYYDMRELASAMPGTGVEQIDAGGLYAALTKYELYARHEFPPFEGCAFGPDVAWGLWLRQQGYQNYIDWGVEIEHRRRDGRSLHPRTTVPVRAGAAPATRIDTRPRRAQRRNHRPEPQHPPSNPRRPTRIHRPEQRAAAEQRILALHRDGRLAKWRANNRR
jgi:hypothetical protein